MGITQIDCVTKEITYREFTADEIAQKEQQIREEKANLDKFYANYESGKQKLRDLGLTDAEIDSVAISDGS